VGPGFSPLDERLGLRSGSVLTPHVVDGIVRLGTVLPFAQVPAILAFFTGVTVSAATVRRLTEAAGAAAVAVATEAVADLVATLPEPPTGPAVQLLSVDGAMVPLVGGTWAEVKTLALGTVIASSDGAVRTEALSYFSRLADAATFGHLATVETHCRGTSTAGTVVAVTDGAVWCQGFVDLHRPDAVRILDFPHALEHLGLVAQAVFGPGTAAGSEWLGHQAQRVRTGQAAAVLTALTALAAAQQSPDIRAVIEQTHAYLAARRGQLRYDAFVAAGYPIGSGCVESANKLVVEARLKGPGMHWAREHVNPLLALRGVLVNNRWAEAWPAIWDRLCHPPRPPESATPPEPQAPPPTVLAPPPVRVTTRLKTMVNGKPTAQHPWRRSSPFPFHAKS
jgi:hypothetical protein